MAARPPNRSRLTLLSDCRVLCFDEFHVHDIGDAMLITRLFKALFRRGILLMVTSNYPPEGLLPNPLYHARFKPVSCWKCVHRPDRRACFTAIMSPISRPCAFP